MAEEHTIQEREEWKRAMLELPDELFFSIMRTYLGEIRTPFHKPALVDRLANFLGHEETVRRIVAFIDDRDAVFITAVDLLGSPHITTLYSLFEEELDYFSFHGRLRNLQERLLVYHRRSDDGIAVNPLLLPVLRHGVIRAPILFEYRHSEKEEDTEKSPRITETHLHALIAYLLIDDKLLKSDGTLKKKSSDRLARVFSSEDGGQELFHRLLRAATNLGLLERRESRIIPKRRALDAFAEMPREVRTSALWAAAFDGGQEASGREISSLPPRELYRRSRLLRSVLDSMPNRTVFTFSGLRRLIRVCTINAGMDGRYLPVRPEEMVELGLLEERDEGVSLAFGTRRELEASPIERPILIQPDFSVTVQPPVDFPTGVRISELFDIRNYDIYPRYELTKYSYTRARSHRFTYEELIAFIEEHSENEPPHNIVMTIKAWERAFSGVSLYEGIILEVDEERSHLVDHTPGLQEHILHSFGGGLYLLDPSTVDEWTRALEKSGIEPVPPIHRPGSETRAETAQQPGPPLASIYAAELRNELREDESDEARSPLSAAPGSPSRHPAFSSAQEKLDADELYEELRRAAEPLSLSENQRRELQQYIDHKLLLFPEQVGRHMLSDETTEARGIDYSGKVRIVEQSVSHEFDLLEIVQRMPAGKPKRMLLRPERLERGEKELYLNGRELPHGEVQRIPVGKISYVKRWKSSLFTGLEDSNRR